MADVDLKYSLSPDGSQDQLAAVLTASISRAFRGLGPDLAKDFASAFKSAFSGIDGSLEQALRGAQKQARVATEQIRDIEDALRRVGVSAGALKGGIREGFDPRAIDFFESSLENVIKLQDELLNAQGDPEALVRIGRAATLARSELVATKTGYQQVALASREAANAIARDTNQVSRERIAASKAETARLVVDKQTAASREVAAIRASSQEQVALTQAAAKRRAAAFQLVGRVVQSVERGIRNTFQATSRIISSAFNGIGRGASAAATTLSSVFRRANRTTVNNFGDANSSITNSYRRSFRRNTSIVNNELDQQESRVREFAREATEEVGSIGIGRLGAFAAVGVLAGKALRGGFERAATLEDSERALTALLGSVEQAQELRSRVLDVVTGTPFKLDQFANAATQLVAFNLEAEKVPRVLQAVADAAAVRGGDAGQTIESLVRVFGQIQSSGRLTGEDLNQLSEAGIPALQVLGNAYGELGGEMRDMISDGAVPAEDAIRILTDGILEGSEGVNGATAAFGGLAQQLGGTLRGSIGNFSAAFDRLGATVITKFQPLFISAIGAAIEVVDVLSSAFSSLGDAIVASPIYRIVGNLFENLGSQVEAAGEKLKPVFDFIAEGLVAFGTAVGVVAGLRRIPLAISAITFAITRLLAPMNLLIAAGVVVSGFISRLIRENPDLAASLSALGNSLRRIATIVTDLAADAFDFLANVLDEVITPAVEFLADKIVGVAVPALDALNGFLTDRVIPAFRDVARFIRSDVLPWLGDRLSRVVEIARDAFRSLVDFIRSKVVPIIGPILGSAVDIARNAFEAAYRFLSETFLPFIRSDLAPVLAGLGAGLAALSFGNVPLAGLLAGGGLAVAAFRNDELRNSIINFFQDTADRVRDVFSNLFDGDVLKRVGVGALRLAREVGRTLGNIATDPRLLGALSAIVAAAAAVAGAFALGLVEGISSNIPEIADGIARALTTALGLAVKEAAKAKAVTALALGLFGGALFLRGVAQSGKAAAAVFQQAASLGPGNGFRARDTGGAAFIRSLIGGPDAIAKNVQAQFRAAQAVTVREGQRLQRIAVATTGATIRSPAGQFLKQTDAEGIARGYDEIARSVGRTNLAAGQLRAGIGQIGDAFRRSTPFLSNFQDGLRSVGQGVKTAFQQFGAQAGIAGGAALAGAFISKAAFDLEASGTERLGGVAAALTSGIFAGVATGNVAVGAAVTGFSLLGGAFLASRERAEKLRKEISDLATELADLAPGERAAAVEEDVAQRLRDVSVEAAELLTGLTFDVEAFQEAAGAGRGVSFLADQLRLLGPAGEDFATRIRSGELGLKDFNAALLLASGIDYNNLRAEIEASGLSVDDFGSAFVQLSEIVNVADSSLSEARTKAAFFGSELEATPFNFYVENIGGMVGSLEDQAAASEVAAGATRAFKDRLDELKQARVDELRGQVDEARTALDKAGEAADAAKEKVRQFLSGENVLTPIAVQMDEAVIAVGNIGESINSLGAGAAEAAGSVGAEFRLSIAEAAEEVSGLLANAQPVSSEEARAILSNVIAEAEAVGGEGGAALLAEIERQIALVDTSGFQTAVSEAFDAQEFQAAAQSAVDAADARLQLGIELDPTKVASWVEDAAAQFDTVGSELSAGLASGVEGNTAGVAAVTQMAQDALQAAKDTLGISSPSTVFAGFGSFSVAGYAQGLIQSTPLAENAARQVGVSAVQALVGGMLSTVGLAVSAARLVAVTAASAFTSARGTATAAGIQVGLAAMNGFRAGILARAGSVISAARAVASAAAAAMRSALVIQSPSKVTREIGEFFGEGFAEGITDTTSSTLTAAVQLANRALRPLNDAGKEAAKAIGRGFAEGGVDFLGSIGSAMDKAYESALSKADQFKVIGKNIAANLFENQGATAAGIFGGGTASAQLAIARLQADTIGTAFRERTKSLLEDKGFFALDFGKGARNPLGRENRQDFLEAGLEIREFAAKLIDSGASIAEVTATTKRLRDELVRAGNERGLGLKINAGVTNELLTSLGLTNAQLDEFVRSVNNVEAATRAATRAEEERIAVTSGASAAGPVFRDLVVQAPTGDPEAVALFVANRVAWAARRN